MAGRPDKENPKIRERIMQLLSEDYQPVNVAATLNVSYGAVRGHLDKMRKIANVHSMHGLVGWYLRGAKSTRHSPATRCGTIPQRRPLAAS